MFHYVCLKHVHGFRKTKARTKTNQTPQYVILEFKKKKGGGGREAAETGCPALSFWQICNSQTRGDSPRPSLTSRHPSDIPVLPAGSPPPHLAVAGRQHPLSRAGTPPAVLQGDGFVLVSSPGAPALFKISESRKQLLVG